MVALFGHTATLTQENGPDIELRIFGDEFYSRYETKDGYPVIYDPERGLFCYALLDQGRFVSSGVPASSAPPPGARPHVEESREVRQEKAARVQAERTKKK